MMRQFCLTVRIRPDGICGNHNQAASWTKPRRVIAKVEWHPELYPRVGFIVTNMSCKNWYPNSRTLSDGYAHRGAINRSISSCTFLLTGRISSDSEGR